MDAQLGTEAAGAREIEIGEELRLVIDRRRHAGDWRCDCCGARGHCDAARRVDESAFVAGQVEVQRVVQGTERDALDTRSARERIDVRDAPRRLHQWDNESTRAQRRGNAMDLRGAPGFRAYNAAHARVSDK